MDYFKDKKQEFDLARTKEDGFKLMEEAKELIKDVGDAFLVLNGGELTDAQFRLGAYKLRLAEYAHELNREYEILSLEIKNIKAKEWDIVTEEIKAKEGKVKNKEQIENIINQKTLDLQTNQVLYETLYFKFKLQISAIDSVITSLTQRIAILRGEIKQGL